MVMVTTISVMATMTAIIRAIPITRPMRPGTLVTITCIMWVLTTTVALMIVTFTSITTMTMTPAMAGLTMFTATLVTTA